jgi:hypothetical protein
MQLKKKIPAILFIVTISIWAISLVQVLLPLNPWSEPVYPKYISPNVLNQFLATTALATAMSLAMGLRIMFQKTDLKETPKSLASVPENLHND